ncbi:MAG: hypothetical protein IIU00_02960 [Clostridia bacterium]|nr:hypothetical protein [Clostridia bacterium]
MDDEYLLPYACLYQNSAGEILRFDGREDAPYLIQTSAMFDYQWSMTTYDRARRDGGRLVFARRAVQDKSLVLDVFADTQAAHNAALNRLHDVLDYDVCHLSPGRLYINNHYIECFASVSVKTLDRDWTTYSVVGLTFKVISPAWTKDYSHTLAAGTASLTFPDTSLDGENGLSSADETPMTITIYGPCENPVVTVGGNSYGVNITLSSSSDYVVIDQQNKKIRACRNGVWTNVFNLRNKTTDVFQPAPTFADAAGSRLSVSRSDSNGSAGFAVDVLFHVRRSEPRWNEI